MLFQVFEYYSLAPEEMLNVLCSQERLEYYLYIPSKVNITELADTLCSLNFTQVAEELEQNFKVDMLMQKVIRILLIL